MSNNSASQPAFSGAGLKILCRYCGESGWPGTSVKTRSVLMDQNPGEPAELAIVSVSVSETEPVRLVDDADGGGGGGSVVSMDAGTSS